MGGGGAEPSNPLLGTALDLRDKIFNDHLKGNDRERKNSKIRPTLLAIAIYALSIGCPIKMTPMLFCQTL